MLLISEDVLAARTPSPSAEAAHDTGDGAEGARLGPRRVRASDADEGTPCYHNVYPPSITRAAPVM